MKAGFIPFVSMVTVLCEYFPCTDTKGFRYKVSVRGFKPKFYDATIPDVDYQYVAQYCAERYIESIGVPWIIICAGMLPNGDHVFIVRGK